MLARLALTFALGAYVCPAALYAQPTQLPQPVRAENPEFEGAAPAHVAHVDGAVTLEREGRAETSPLNMPILSGDRLRTAEGRVEVLFADGSTLHLDLRSTIDVQSDDLVRLTDGRMRLNLLGVDAARSAPAGFVSYRIDSSAGSARITQPGEYRLALLKGTDEVQLELAVIRGAAEIFTEQGSTPVRAGERAYASAGLAPSYAYAYNSATWDPFDRWSEARRDVRLGVSSQYLPSDMQTYAPLLDESGDWRYTQSYGYAWYPRVAEHWRPYYHGRWASYPRYGWTWIGADRFAWPTHHYGRWGFSAGAWFWVPSSRWAPAYVSWGYAPGYVSWCPLGIDNRPIFGVNIYGNGSGHYSSWRGWTAVSNSHFGGRDHWVNQRAVNWDRQRGPRPRFETRPSAPGLARDVAVARNSTPIRWAGSRSGASNGAGRDLGRDEARRSGSPGRDTALPGREAGTPGREAGTPGREAGASARSRASAPRDSASPARDSAPPRYINRGDEIVRSQTERPAPRAGSASRAVPRSEDGTIPEEAARQARPAPNRETPSVERPAARDRPVDAPSASTSPRAEPRGDGGQGRSRATGAGVDPSPSYQPSYRPFDPSNASGSRRTEPRGDSEQNRARAYERSRPAPEAQAAPQQPTSGRVERPSPSRVEGPAPSRFEGSSSRQPAPSRVEGPAPERAAPVERASPVERATPAPAAPAPAERGAPAPAERAAPVERAPSRADSPNRGDSGQPQPQRPAAGTGSGSAGGSAVPRAGGGSGSSSSGAAAPRRGGRGGV